MKTYVGIDPGLSGGITALGQDGNIRGMMAMPTIQFDRRNTVDVNKVLEFIQAQENPFVVIESAQKHSAGTNALSSTWFGYGRLTAMLEIAKVPYEVIAAPRTWQKQFWTTPKMPKGQKFDTKGASVNMAKRLFPNESFLPSSRCTKPSDGMTDATLIAEWGRRKGL